MNFDLYWILERRHADGAWEAVQSEQRFWEDDRWRCDNDDPRTAIYDPPQACLHRLSFPARLHPQETAIAIPGLPEDLSSWSRTVLLVLDAWAGNFTFGHLTTDAIPSLHHPDTKPFLKGLRTVLASPLAALPLARMIRAPHNGVPALSRFDDLEGMESAHTRLEREARGRDLLRPHLPGSWRLLISYR